MSDGRHDCLTGGRHGRLAASASKSCHTCTVAMCLHVVERVAVHVATGGHCCMHATVSPVSARASFSQWCARMRCACISVAHAHMCMHAWVHHARARSASISLAHLWPWPCAHQSRSSALDSSSPPSPPWVARALLLLLRRLLLLSSPAPPPLFLFFHLLLALWLHLFLCGLRAELSAQSSVRGAWHGGMAHRQVPIGRYHTAMASAAPMRRVEPVLGGQHFWRTCRPEARDGAYGLEMLDHIVTVMCT